MAQLIIGNVNRLLWVFVHNFTQFRHDHNISELIMHSKKQKFNLWLEWNSKVDARLSEMQYANAMS